VWSAQNRGNPLLARFAELLEQLRTEFATQYERAETHDSQRKFIAQPPFVPACFFSFFSQLPAAPARPLSPLVVRLDPVHRDEACAIRFAFQFMRRGLGALPATLSIARAVTTPLPCVSQNFRQLRKAPFPPALCRTQLIVRCLNSGQSDP
jgi:hypothetical protein